MIRTPEPRIQISLDVKVWGVDHYGQPFVQHARTVNASTAGARLIGIDCVRVGEVISLQHGTQQSRCRVVWVGRDVARARQIGIQSLDAGRSLFGASLRAALAKPSPPETGTFLRGARAARPLRTAPRSTMREAPGTRRSQQRFHCTGGVEMRRNEGAPPVFGNLSDISLTGCYVETVSSFPVGTELLYMIRISDTVLRGRASVMTSHHAVGVGLGFVNMSEDDRKKLEFLVGNLAGTEDMRPQEQRNVVAEDPLRKPQPFSGSARPSTA